MLDFRGTLMAQLGIKCHHSTAYHLQTDSEAEKLNTAVECYLKAEQFLHPKDWDHFVPLVEFTDITTYDQSPVTFRCRAYVGFVLRMLIYLPVPIPSAYRMPKSSLEADEFAEQMMSDLCMLREQLEEAQTRMILEANKSCCPHNVMVGDSIYVPTKLLLIGYANLSNSESANVNSRTFQQPFCVTFRITKAISTNSFRMNTLHHWKMPNVFNFSHLKQNRVD
jgi:hypothetical protein